MPERLRSEDELPQLPGTAEDRRPLDQDEVQACGQLACDGIELAATQDGTTDKPVQPPSEPTLAERIGATKVSKRGLLKGFAIGSILAAEATTLPGMVYWIVKGSSTPAGRVLTARDRFVDMLTHQPTAEEVVAELYAIPGVEHYIDIAAELAKMNDQNPASETEEETDMSWLDDGNSYTYMLGVMNDNGGLFDQQNAISSVAMNGLRRNALRALRLGGVMVASCAQIGARSGNRYDDERGVPPYGFLSDKQLGSRDVQAFLLNRRGIAIERRDLELDDLRGLITTSAALISSMDDLTALFTNDKLSQEAEGHLEWLKAQVPAIARQAAENYLAAAAILGGISAARIRRGFGALFHVPVICWDLYDQENMPANTTSELPSDGAKKYLVTDPTGPNRYFLQAGSIPYGHEAAHWIWVEMMKARIWAIRQLRARYGDTLRIVPENLSRVNRDPDFYRTELLGKNGNGHEGPKGIVDMAGVELELVRNRTESGILIARSMADITAPKAA